MLVGQQRSYSPPVRVPVLSELVTNLPGNARALARAGKKVLHVDKNPYYGDEYAALSLAELQAWAAATRSSRLRSVQFRTHESKTGARLAESRSYTLNLAPGLLYTTSPILSLLVDCNLHESLEFLKVGGWFVYRAGDETQDSLMAVPNSREDVFNDSTLDPRTKRIVVRALKSILGFESNVMAASPSPGTSLQEYLEAPSFSLPPQTIAAFTSLTLLHDPPSAISFEKAENDIRKHFGSLGRFGPGFAAVVARYGSGSELVQALCRAAAVTGNAVYVLDNAVTNIHYHIHRPQETANQTAGIAGSEELGVQLHLRSGDQVWTRRFITTESNLPDGSSSADNSASEPVGESYWMSVYILSSSLEKLFQTADPPTAAAAVVYMPAGKDDGSNDDSFLDLAATSLLDKMPNEDGSVGEILASVKYQYAAEPITPLQNQTSEGVYLLREHIPMIKIPDEVMTEVVDLYETIVGSREGFMDKQELEDQGAPTEETNA
ncbi:hypothetical protein Dda_2902 [Drechslerella dactyloides]|uniref:Rab proteins geranylgeranyltransferase n=1 Tax=Drechslerella dactyloides TaxID=74499 RepID=A0AAD6J1C3_DREDA|nr:hypothetical protein Dda_2902 [Drechslerella dactyloides]